MTPYILSKVTKMYLNQCVQNKNDSIDNNHGDNSKNVKNDDGNKIVIIIMIIIIIVCNNNK